MHILRSIHLLSRKLQVLSQSGRLRISSFHQCRFCWTWHCSGTWRAHFIASITNSLKRQLYVDKPSFMIIAHTRAYCETMFDKLPLRGSLAHRRAVCFEAGPKPMPKQGVYRAHPDSRAHNDPQKESTKHPNTTHRGCLCCLKRLKYLVEIKRTKITALP